MKKLFVIFTIFVLSGCVSTNMISPNKQPKLQPESNKSTLVLIRNYSVGFNVVFSHYIDKKFIGETKGKSYIVSQVPAGKRHLIISAGNTVCYEINFLSGKTYYLEEGYAWPGNVTGFTPVSRDEAKKAISGCTYLEIDPNSNVPDMDSNEYQNIVKNYQAELKQNPEGFKSVLNYRGE